jgi:hypothetical protein
MKIVMSSGHSKYVRGASAILMRSMRHGRSLRRGKKCCMNWVLVVTYHDDGSRRATKI